MACRRLQPVVEGLTNQQEALSPSTSVLLPLTSSLGSTLSFSGRSGFLSLPVVVCSCGRYLFSPPRGILKNLHQSECISYVCKETDTDLDEGVY